MKHLSEEFWSQRYREDNTGWDIGYPSTPLKEYIDQLEDRNIQILIPGCGSGYEAEYLFNLGFKNVFILDLSKEPLKKFTERVPGFPADHVLHGSFFDLEGEYDLILEQTLFCAVDPTLRPEYAKSASRLLKKGGKLVGVMFNFPLEDGPPYGGEIDEYLDYFTPLFSAVSIEPCHNSIKPRQGREVFVKMVK